MLIPYFCEGCGKRYRVTDSARKVRCPECQTVGDVNRTAQPLDAGWDDAEDNEWNDDNPYADNALLDENEGDALEEFESLEGEHHEDATRDLELREGISKSGTWLLLTGGAIFFLPFIGIQLVIVNWLPLETQLGIAFSLLALGIFYKIRVQRSWIVKGGLFCICFPLFCCGALFLSIPFLDFLPQNNIAQKPPRPALPAAQNKAAKDRSEAQMVSSAIRDHSQVIRLSSFTGLNRSLFESSEPEVLDRSKKERSATVVIPSMPHSMVDVLKNTFDKDVHVHGSTTYVFGSYKAKFHPIDDLSGFANYLDAMPGLKLDRVDEDKRTIHLTTSDDSEKSDDAEPDEVVEALALPIPKRVGDVPLVAHSVIDEKLHLLIPDSFHELPSEELKKMCLFDPCPDAGFANKSEKLKVIITQTFIDIAPHQLSDFMQAMKQELQKEHMKTRWKSDEMKSVNGQDWGCVNFQTSRHLTKLRHRIWITSKDGKLLVISFVLPQEIEEEWLPVIDAVRESLVVGR